MRARRADDDVSADRHGKVARALRLGGHVERHGRVRDDAPELLRKEEEGLAPAVVDLWDQDRSADRVAEVVVTQRRPGDAVQVVEVVVGVQVVVAEELVRRTMQRICARARNHVDLAGRGASVLRRVGIALGLELRDRIHAGKREQRQIRSAVDIVGTVDGPVVRACTLAADGKRDRVCAAQRVGRPKIDLVAGSRIGYAGLQAQQLLVVARAQHQLPYLRAVDQAGDGAVLEVHLQGHVLFRAAYRELTADGQAVIHMQHQARHRDGLKARIRHLDRVGAQGQRSRRVKAGVVGRQRSHGLAAIGIGHP